MLDGRHTWDFINVWQLQTSLVWERRHSIVNIQLTASNTGLFSKLEKHKIRRIKVFFSAKADLNNSNAVADCGIKNK